MADPITSLAAVAVDAVKGTIAERLLDPAVKPAWEALKPILFPWWDPAFHEIRLRLREAVEEQHTKDASYAAALERSLQRGEADALATAFLRAAAQTTTLKRMEMLAAAAAGVFTPDLNSEMRSKVSRAIMQLEPSEVVALRRLDRLERSPGIRIASGRVEPDMEPLLLAGCATENPDRRWGVRVTELGRAVLGALDAWQPQSKAESA